MAGLVRKCFPGSSSPQPPGEVPALIPRIEFPGPSPQSSGETETPDPRNMREAPTELPALVPGMSLLSLRVQVLGSADPRNCFLGSHSVSGPREPVPRHLPRKFRLRLPGTSPPEPRAKFPVRRANPGSHEPIPRKLAGSSDYCSCSPEPIPRTLLGGSGSESGEPSPRNLMALLGLALQKHPRMKLRLG